MSTDRMAKAYANRYLTDDEIGEHIDAICGDLPEQVSLYVCIAQGDTQMLQCKQVDITDSDARNQMLFNDLGFDLAVSKQLLLSSYLVEPSLSVHYLTYLTVDGRTSCFSYKDGVTKESEPRRMVLLEHLVRGFISGYQSRVARMVSKQEDSAKGPNIIIP